MEKTGKFIRRDQLPSDWWFGLVVPFSLYKSRGSKSETINQNHQLGYLRVCLKMGSQKWWLGSFGLPFCTRVRFEQLAVGLLLPHLNKKEVQWVLLDTVGQHRQGKTGEQLVPVRAGVGLKRKTKAASILRFRFGDKPM